MACCRGPKVFSCFTVSHWEFYQATHLVRLLAGCHSCGARQLRPLSGSVSQPPLQALMVPGQSKTWDKCMHIKWGILLCISSFWDFHTLWRFWLPQDTLPWWQWPQRQQVFSRGSSHLELPASLAKAAKDPETPSVWVACSAFTFFLKSACFCSSSEASLYLVQSL